MKSLRCYLFAFDRVLVRYRKVFQPEKCWYMPNCAIHLSQFHLHPDTTYIICRQKTRFSILDSMTQVHRLSQSKLYKNAGQRILSDSVDSSAP